MDSQQCGLNIDGSDSTGRVVCCIYQQDRLLESFKHKSLMSQHFIPETTKYSLIYPSIASQGVLATLTASSWTMPSALRSISRSCEAQQILTTWISQPMALCLSTSMAILMAMAIATSTG